MLDFITAYFQTEASQELSHQWLPEFEHFWAHDMPHIAMSPQGWVTVMNHLVERAEAHLAFIGTLEPAEEHGYYWVWLDNHEDAQSFVCEARKLRDTATRFAEGFTTS